MDISVVIKIMTHLSSVVLFLISVYTFRLTVFSKKLRFIQYRNKFSAFGGESLEITLENRALNPVSIESIELIIGENRVSVFNGHCTIEAFKLKTIKMEPFSYIIYENRKMYLNDILKSRPSLWIKTSRGIQYVKYNYISTFIQEFRYNQYLKLNPATVVRNKYNEKIIAKGVKYALSFKDEQGNIKTIFIHKSGMMSEMLFGYNSLPKEIIKNKKSLRKHFNPEFEKLGIKYNLEKFKMI